MLVTASPTPCPVPRQPLPSLSARLFTAPVYTDFAQLICTCWHHLFFSCVLIESVWALPPPQMYSRAGTWNPPRTGAPQDGALLLPQSRTPEGEAKSYSSFISLPTPVPHPGEPCRHHLSLTPSGRASGLQRKPPSPTSSHPLED